MKFKFSIVLFGIMAFFCYSQDLKLYTTLLEDIANVSTPGYKSLELLDYPNITWSYIEQGSLVKTDNPLDISILGDGYYKVIDPVSGNSLFTRSSSFYFNEAGYLCSSNGYRLDPCVYLENQKFLEMYAQGNSIYLITSTGTEQKKRIIPVKLYNIGFLSDSIERLDGVYFKSSNPMEITKCAIKSGFLEMSNVRINASLYFMKLCLLTLGRTLDNKSYYDAKLKLIDDLLQMAFIVTLTRLETQGAGKPSIDNAYLEKYKIKKVFSTSEWIKIIDDLRL